MDNKCFTKYVFWSWIGYAFWQGLLVISFAFLFNQTTHTSISSDGKTFNFWSGGMTVYGTSVLIVNAVLLKMATSYTGYQEAMILLQVGTYWVILFIETQFSVFHILYCTWSELMFSSAAWMGVLLVFLCVFSIDIIGKRLVIFTSV